MSRASPDDPPRRHLGTLKGMSLFTSAARFARSPAGRKALDKAKTMASDPKNKERIDQVRKRLAERQQRPR